MQCHECGGEALGHSACPGCGATLPVTVRGPRLPDEPWPLTAPESYVLRYGLGNHAHALAGFKLALIELVARRALTLRGAWIRRRWAPGRSPTFLLCDGPENTAAEERSLRPVVALHANLVERRPSLGVPFEDAEAELRGVSLTKFVSVAARRHGGYRGYLERDVASSLRQRALLSAVNGRTAAGDRAREQLDAWLDVTRSGLFGWSHDQTWLRAYLGGAGAAVFLAAFATPGLPVLKHIGSAVATCATPDWTYSPAEWDANGIDFAGLADSLAGAFSAIDAGFIDAGGGGGGDGG
jgi:hypothetical protein